MTKTNQASGWQIIVLIMLISVIGFMLVEMISPLFYSEETKTEMAAEQAQQRTEQIAQIEEERRQKALGIIDRVHYVQDARTGICFAVYSYYRHGYLASVDCDDVPAELLNIRDEE